MDEIRTSAEAMSRLIIKLHQFDDDEVSEDPFEEVGRDGVGVGDDDTVVRMEMAKRMIGTASLKSEQTSICWSKMRLNVYFIE